MAKERVCLAYSGGLDTSVILAWLIEQGYEVIAFCADVGQGDDFDAAREKALKIGAKDFIVEDLTREFVEELLFRAIQCNAIYEDRYLLGTSLARPVIARAQIRVAQRTGCGCVSHGCTGKGNDQVRFELAFHAISPGIKVIAPWRDPAFFQRFPGRDALLNYSTENGIPVSQTKAKPFSMDANLAHCSYEAGVLEDTSKPPAEDMWVMTDSPLKAPDSPEDLTIEFKQGIPVAVTVKGSSKPVTDSVDLFLLLNQLGKRHGVGRIDIVENRYIGLKSRGCYDSPAMTILRLAHIDIESLCLDGQVRALRDQFVTFNWSRLLYIGLYFSPEREFLENSLVFSQKYVNGKVDLRLYKGSVSILGRSSETSKLYSQTQASMDELTDFDATATTGFIIINALRLGKFGQQKEEDGESLSRA